MANLINKSTKKIISVEQFKLMYPNTSFGTFINFDEFDYEVVFDSPVPLHDPMTEKVVELEPEYVNNKWVRKYEVVALLAWEVQQNIDKKNADLVAAVKAAVQQRLDAFAQTKQYDSILSATTYATSTNAKFAAEGQYCVEARDATWAKCYKIMDEVLSGNVAVIPTIDEVLNMLPALTWPQ